MCFKLLITTQKTNEHDKTLKRDKTSRNSTSSVAASATLRKKRQSRDASLRMITDTMRTSDSSVFTTNQSGTLRASDLSAVDVSGVYYTCFLTLLICVV
jgi:CCR4-NOT transcriptional regulation complex NOT5 subunit